MSTALTDLDALVAPPREVRVGGRDWKVPASPPVAWMLAYEQLVTALDDSTTERDLVVLVRDQVTGLFEIHQPGETDAIHAALGQLDASTLLRAIGAIYGDQGPEADAAPPTRAKAKARAGTRSTSRKPNRSS